MDAMSLAAAVSLNSQENLANAVGMRVMRMAMDHSEAAALSLIEALPEAPHPHLGQAIDVKA